MKPSNKFSQAVPQQTPEVLNLQKFANSNLHSENSTVFHLQLITACSSQSMRELKQVKESIVNIKKLHRQGKKHLPVIELSHAENLTDAISQASVEPDFSIVLACGYPTVEIRSALAEYSSTLPIVIISHPPEHTERYHTPTSSLLEERTITRVKSLEEGVRKLILRHVIRQLGEIRPIIEQLEFEQYFSLRFRIWNDMGYIAPDRDLQQDGWEIDHFDRFSLPIGFFSHNNELLACCRLVQQYGCESTKNVRSISKLLEHNNKQVAAQAFSYTGKFEQPFDILCEFRGFREYYRSLVHKQTTVAEVSRVIVDPGYRRFGLAETLVDSLVSVAKVQGIDVFMLACREALSPLYQRCGFVAVPNLISEKFLSISEKSIVMERVLNRGKK